MSRGEGVIAPADVAAAPAGPGHTAAREARDLIEEALFSFVEIALAFDRHGVRDRLLRAIHLLYVARGTPVIAVAHLEGLSEVAAVTAECATLLASVGDPASTPPLQRAIAVLTRAGRVLRDAAEAVARIQLARRPELIGARIDEGPPAARPFRASVGVPSLHAFARRPIMPHIVVEPSGDVRSEASGPAVRPPRVETVAELKSFAQEAISGVLATRENAPEPPQAGGSPVVPLLAYEPAIEEVDFVRRLGRDCLEDIANLRNLRKPNMSESWLDQEPFEARLLENVDAFVALGNAALPSVSLYHAEADGPDPERAFAVALTLGCIEGMDTVSAAVMMLKQSAPEEHPGWSEGLWLAPNSAIDLAMADLCTSTRPELIPLALDVLHARGVTPDHVVTALLDRPEVEIAARVARALATVLPPHDAIDCLERICATTGDDDVFLAAVESLLRRGHGPALSLVRRTIDGPPVSERGTRAVPLLCLTGRASDLDRLLAAANAKPTVRIVRGLGRYGHVESLGTLVNWLAHEDPDIVAAAAEALERITGAGLRETSEEPWDLELPPEALTAGGIPIPMRKVDRVVTDPDRWSAWVRDNARRLDAKLKTRGGVPFRPSQVVDELEARAAPPDRREEAALEIALVTGITASFSPDDWVARQTRQLAKLRADVARVPFSPGAWSIAAQRHPLPDEAAVEPARSPRQPSASEQTPRPPSVAPTAATSTATPAPALNETASFDVSALLPALPFAQRPPTQEAAAPPPAAPLPKRAPASLSGTSLAQGIPRRAALPFGPGSPQATTPPNVAPAGPPPQELSSSPQLVGQTDPRAAASPPQSAAPSQVAARRPGAPDPASGPVPDHTGAPTGSAPGAKPAPAALTGTSLGLVIPKDFVLPFGGVPARSAAPPPAATPAPTAAGGPRTASSNMIPSASGTPDSASGPVPDRTAVPTGSAPGAKPAPAALTGTSLGLVIPKNFVLPFGGAPARSAAPPTGAPPAPTSAAGPGTASSNMIPSASGAPDPQGAPSVVETATGLTRPVGPALPFRPAAPSRATPALPAAPVVSSAGPAASAGGSPRPAISLEYYSALCVEIASDPRRAAEICARYGLNDAAAWQATDREWQARFRVDAVLRARWEALMAQYRAAMGRR